MGHKVRASVTNNKVLRIEYNEKKLINFLPVKVLDSMLPANKRRIMHKLISFVKIVYLKSSA